MAWGFVQGAAPASTNGTGTNHDVAFGSNVTAGNRIVVVAEINENTGTGTGGALTISTASGTATLGTWRQVVQTSNLAAGSFSCLGAIWTAPVTGSGSLTVRAAGGNAANAWQIASAIIEYSGLDSTDALSAVDVSATSVWNPGTFQIQAPATNFANELVVGGYFSDGASNTITVGSGFAHLEFSGNSNISEAASEDEDSGAAGSQPTVTWTGATNADKATAVAIFKLPATVGGAAIAAINPGQTWKRQFWRGLLHPFPGAPPSATSISLATDPTSSAFTSGATGALSSAVALSGTTASSGLWKATLSASIALSGTSSSPSTLTAAPSEAVALAGTAQVVGTASSTSSEAVALSGSPSALASLTASPSEAVALAATLAARSTVAGSAGTGTPINGSASSSSAWSATLSAAVALSGGLTGSSSTTAALAAAVALSGSSASPAGLVASLLLAVALTGTSDARSTATGTATTGTGPTGPGSVQIFLSSAFPTQVAITDAFPAQAFISAAFPASVFITDIYGGSVSFFVGKAMRIANWGGTTGSPTGGFRNSSGTLYDPPSPAIRYRIANQTEVTVSGGSLTHDGTGLYSTVVTPAVDGDLMATAVSGDGAYADPQTAKIEPAPL